jgi:hypothetical protein
MPWWIYVAAYFDACIVGGLVVAVCLYGARRLILKKKPDFFDLPAFLGGAVERFVALTLVIWAPPYLPPFVGGWVLLKFAIGWQREGYGGNGKDEVEKGRFLALMGNVLSFGWAIFVGALLNPEALDVWARPHS